MIAGVHDDGGDDGNDKASVSFWLNGSNRAVRHHKHAHNSNYTPLLSMCICACLFSAPFIPACHPTTPALLILPYISVSHYSLCTASVRCGPDLSSLHKDASLLHLASPLKSLCEKSVFFLQQHIASQLEIIRHYLLVQQQDSEFNVFLACLPLWTYRDLPSSQCQVWGVYAVLHTQPALLISKLIGCIGPCGH